MVLMIKISLIIYNAENFKVIFKFLKNIKRLIIYNDLILSGYCTVKNQRAKPYFL